MTVTAPTSNPDPVKSLGQHLKSEGQRADFDMRDAPELPLLEPFPILHRAVKWLGEHLLPAWQEADAHARRHQAWHDVLAHTAVGTGVGAIVFAILQLVLQQCWPSVTGLAAVFEAVAALSALVAVGVGFTAKFNRKWLGHRHRAERLRMLKFQALARPELWQEDYPAWEKWVRRQMQALPDPSDLHALRDWSRHDAPETEPLPVQAPAPPAELESLKVYYLHKRLFNQGSYFKRKGGQAGGHWSVRFRHQRVLLFALTMGCVLFHFAADLAVERLETAGNPAAAHLWHIASSWGLALAAILPVLGIGIRALADTTELSRKARSFEAKHEAMNRAAALLEEAPHDLAFLLNRLAHDELFLEQEHREWLRLLLDAEWFL